MVASAQFFFFFKAALLSLMDSSAVLRVPTRTRQQGNNLISLMGCLADSDWPLFPAPSPHVHRRTQTDRGGGGRNTADTPQSVCGCRRSMYHTELPVPHVTCSSAVLAAERRLQRPLLSAPRCSFVFSQPQQAELHPVDVSLSVPGSSSNSRSNGFYCCSCIRAQDQGMDICKCEEHFWAVIYLFFRLLEWVNCRSVLLFLWECVFFFMHGNRDWCDVGWKFRSVRVCLAQGQVLQVQHWVKTEHLDSWYFLPLPVIRTKWSICLKKNKNIFINNKYSSKKVLVGFSLNWDTGRSTTQQKL